MEKQGKIYLFSLIVTSVITVLLIAASFLSSFVSLSSLFVSSEIEKHTFTVSVQENGAMDVYEEIEYNLSEANGVIRDYKYDASKNQKLELQSVTINDEIELKEVNSASKGNSGIYTFFDSGKRQEIKIYQPTDGRLKVKLHYLASGVITQYNDMQAMDWTFYDSRNDAIAPLNMSVNVTFSTDIQKENMKVFGHGDLDGTVFPTSARTVDVEIPVFRENTFGTLVVLLPTKPLSAMTNIVATNKFQEALDFELNAAQETNNQIAENASSMKFKETMRIIALIVGNILLIVSIPLAFIYFRKIYNKYDKELYKGELDYYRDIPGTYGPAVAALVQDPDKEPDQEQLAAAIFSLYTKSRIKIETINRVEKKKDVEEVYITVLESDTTDLPKNEKLVYEWLEEFGQGEQFLYKDFLCDNKKKDIAKEEKFIRNYERFISSVKREFKSLHYLEYFGRGKKMFMLHPIFALILMLLAIAAVFLIDNIFLAIIFGAGVVALFSMNTILVLYKTSCYQFTKEGAEQNDKCKALKRFLEDFSALNEAPIKSAALWQQYFVYGLALGVTDAALANLYAKLPKEQLEKNDVDFASIYMMNRLMTYYAFRTYSYNAVANTAHRVSAEEARVSRSSGGSSFGGGGGFSGGGSFGGGGGGGGSSSF